MKEEKGKKRKKKEKEKGKLCMHGVCIISRCVRLL